MRFARTAWTPAPRPAPPGQTLWAIGDVHGHLAELQALRRWVLDSTAQAAPGSMTLVHLGDYIDRGPDARGVIDELLRPLDHPAQQVFLVGNHEQFLRELIAQDPALDRAFLTGWFNNGAAQTLDSLGVTGYGRLLQANRLAELGALVAAALGPDRLRFIVDQLQLIHQVGDYLFVHAGIDPALPLEAQDFADLLLVREPFLSHLGLWPHTFCVVHPGIPGRFKTLR